MDKERWSLKDKLEVAEAVFTIIVSTMAIWGTIVAWENGFWHKLKHIADHLHERYEQEEIEGQGGALMKLEQDVKKLEKKVK
ncbi:MAG: hypothetical protein KHX55_06610 [Proteobacteria bacterium]|nr:hypothetical protein [Pseudomonadota bacterium]